VAALLFFTWAQVQLLSRAGGVAIGVLVLLPPLAALAILLAIWPRFHVWVDPGRGLTETRAPELFQMLRDVARITRQPMPRRLYLFDAVNAFVANRGMFLGRAIGIGLPLFEILTVAELRAVVAHEFGHDASRAGGLSTFVYQAARTFVGATDAAGIVPGLDAVFELWAEAFLRIAMPISRQQELRADELACHVAGVETTISALTKISTNSMWGEIADPAPGWEQDLHETHPPLRDRIGLARSLQVTAALPADDRPARVLLETLLSTTTSNSD
jgi:Zn-dependent protease with chaperone function